MSRLRILSPLVQAPLFFPSQARLYIPGFPKPNSKYAYVVDELIDAGIPRAWIACRRIDNESVAVRLGRLLARLPWAIALILMLKQRSCNLDRFDVQTIIGRELYRRILRKKTSLLPVIISDVSPSLHMLWSAASVEGNRAVFWQDDFHHTSRLPYTVKAAVVLNDAGLSIAADRLPYDRIFRRPTQEPVSMKSIPKKPRIGVATNAFFNGSPTQRETLERIRKSLGASRLHLRLHPTSNLSLHNSLRTWLIVAPAAESIENYASRLDLVAVGNSAVQFKLIQHGVPVVHVDGLDPYPFDLYGYVADRIIYGCEDIARSSLQEIRSFYKNESLNLRLRRLTYLHDTAPVQGLRKARGIIQTG